MYRPVHPMHKKAMKKTAILYFDKCDSGKENIERRKAAKKPSEKSYLKKPKQAPLFMDNHNSNILTQR
jgi:hypothetical protein